METVESINWLKENNLYDSAKTTSYILKKIFIPCLAVKDEKVLIIGDKGAKDKKISSILAGAYYLAAEELKLNAKLVLQGVKSRGAIADSDVIASLADLEEGSAVFVTASDKLGSLEGLGKSYRQLCKKRSHKFVSALSLGDLDNGQLSDIISAIDVNYPLLKIQHDKLKALLDNGNELHITTKSGTDISCGIKGMQAVSADGNYTQPGTGGNLPAGEVYIPPNGKNVNGRVVIDGSSRNHKHTRLIKEPIKLQIEEGKVISIEGGEEAEQLEQALSWAETNSKYPGSVRRVGEFGIGLNPKAKIIGSTLVDEKALGTAHIGIGSNYWFGGNIYAIIHLDQIFKDPEIKIDGELLKT